MILLRVENDLDASAQLRICDYIETASPRLTAGAILVIDEASARVVEGEACHMGGFASERHGAGHDGFGGGTSQQLVVGIVEPLTCLFAGRRFRFGFVEQADVRQVLFASGGLLVANE